MSLLASLPTPSKDLSSASNTREETKSSSGTLVVASSEQKKGFREPPVYRERQGFVPRKIEDFGDGM